MNVLCLKQTAIELLHSLHVYEIIPLSYRVVQLRKKRQCIETSVLTVLSKVLPYKVCIFTCRRHRYRNSGVGEHSSTASRSTTAHISTSQIALPYSTSTVSKTQIYVDLLKAMDSSATVNHATVNHDHLYQYMVIFNPIN